MASIYFCEGNSIALNCHTLPDAVTSEVMDEIRNMGNDIFVVHPDHIDEDVEIVEQRDGYTLVRIKEVISK